MKNSKYYFVDKVIIKIFYIFKAKIPIYAVCILLIFALILQYQHLGGKIIRNRIKHGKADGYWKCYWDKGIVACEGYYNKGVRVGKWYYYNKKGNLSFFADLDKAGKKYNIYSTSSNGEPGEVSYFVSSNEKNIDVSEIYHNGHLLFLTMDIPNRNETIIVEYDEDRYVVDVHIYDIGYSPKIW